MITSPPDPDPYTHDTIEEEITVRTSGIEIHIAARRALIAAEADGRRRANGAAGTSRRTTLARFAAARVRVGTLLVAAGTALAGEDARRTEPASRVM